MARRTKPPIDTVADVATDTPVDIGAETRVEAAEPLVVDMPELGAETAQDAVETAPSQPSVKAKNTGLTLALGAVLGLGAAALGYGAALKFPLQSLTAPSTQTPPAQTAEIADLAAKVAALDTASLQARITALEQAPPVDLTALQNRIAALETKLAAQPPSADLRAELSAIRDRLAQTDPAPAIKAAIEGQMGAVESKASAMVAEVTKAAQAAAQSSAMTLLQAAIDTGAPFAAAAQQLDLPKALTDFAETGVPSLSDLKSSFPDAARAGLEAALRSDMGQTWAERVTNFLRNQTGARSLTPQEGSDPDAILSRVEAGLNRADMQVVMTEIAALPSEAQTAMEGWIARARARADALAAFASLTEKGN